MSRTIRTESAAHAAQLAYIQARAATSPDWRALLATRDAKRTARHYRQGRKPAHGYVLASVAVMLLCVSAFAAMAWQSAAPAVHALASVHQCDESASVTGDSSARRILMHCAD